MCDKQEKTVGQTVRRKDGWKEGRMVGMTDRNRIFFNETVGQTDRRTDGQTDRRTDGQTDRQMEGKLKDVQWKDEGTDRRTDRQTEGKSKDGQWKDGRT